MFYLLSEVGNHVSKMLMWTCLPLGKLGKLRIKSLYCTSYFKNEHQTELQTDASAENYRTRRPRDRGESVCWTWPGHRFFIVIFNNYIDIGNESIHKRIKVLIKFVCKLPFTFYFYSLLQFFNFRTKIPLCPRKMAIAQPPPPPPPTAIGHFA